MAVVLYCGTSEASKETATHAFYKRGHTTSAASGLEDAEIVIAVAHECLGR